VTTNKLHRVHSDLAGPFPFSIHGCRYFVIFFDEFSKKLWVYFMARKSEMFARFKEWRTMAELQSGHLLQEFQSNNGGEYTGTDFRACLRSSGILCRTSTAYTPQQNGKAECSICTILECALLMLRSANLSDGFWQDAVGTAVHLINRSTCTGLK
jgi:transposase InsO family protein